MPDNAFVCMMNSPNRFLHYDEKPQGCVNLVCNLEIGTQFSDSEMHSTILRLCKSLDYVEHIHSYGGNKQYGNY